LDVAREPTFRVADIVDLQISRLPKLRKERLQELARPFNIWTILEDGQSDDFEQVGWKLRDGLSSVIRGGPIKAALPKLHQADPVLEKSNGNQLQF
jgi:hypothetical protein